MKEECPQASFTIVLNGSSLEIPGILVCIYMSLTEQWDLLVKQYVSPRRRALSCDCSSAVLVHPRTRSFNTLPQTNTWGQSWRSMCSCINITICLPDVVYLSAANIHKIVWLIYNPIKFKFYIILIASPRIHTQIYFGWHHFGQYLLSKACILSQGRAIVK